MDDYSTYRPTLDLLYKLDGGVCSICDKEIAREDATRDHIIPVYHHGPDAFWNLRLACQPCNANKGHKMPSIEEVRWHMMRETDADKARSVMSHIMHWAWGSPDPIRQFAYGGPLSLLSPFARMSATT